MIFIDSTTESQMKSDSAPFCDGSKEGVITSPGFIGPHLPNQSPNHKYTRPSTRHHTSPLHPVADPSHEIRSTSRLIRPSRIRIIVPHHHSGTQPATATPQVPIHHVYIGHSEGRAVVSGALRNCRVAAPLIVSMKATAMAARAGKRIVANMTGPGGRVWEAVDSGR